MFLKITSSLFFIFLVFSPVTTYAGSCPTLVAKINNTIASMDQSRYEVIIAAANMLKDQGDLEHKSGDHAKSEDLLNGALRLLDI